MAGIKKTKIICTIGPSSQNKETLIEMVKSGMDIMRMNFSHGSHEEHQGKIDLIREINAELKTDVSILLDTKGPEIRTGDFENGCVEFKGNSDITICYEDVVGTSDKFSITYKELYKDVQKGSHILVNDGAIDLMVKEVVDKDIVCRCLNGGVVKNKRGINVPNIKLGFEYLSEKDIDDIKYGCEQGIDFIAASFVRRRQDVLDIRKLLAEFNRMDVKIIAKIENQEGVSNVDEILEEADGIMVARGDLGVEVPAEMVPMIQKDIINKCNEKRKLVVTATQMLESMQHSPVPTRAEVSDVANAIYDGTDCIMLSGESANGEYPVQAVDMMARIALMTEYNFDYEGYYRKAKLSSPNNKSEAICLSVAEMASQFNVKAIIAFTESGTTAMKMAKYKPKCLLIGATPNPETFRQINAYWGVHAVMTREFTSTGGMKNIATIIAKENGCKPGDTIIITGGTPGVPGATDYLRIVEIQ
ncbi:pyruvate kinase [Floccifex sp.]|uniref:pyruvate kinase n=1 Tax=Floccifex sp. TaxID=2815810 RepID=UPI003EFED05F